MATPRHGRRPGLREVSLLWTLYLVVGAEIFATYARLPPHELYHVSGTGPAAGAGRALVFLNWPVALTAIPMLAVVVTEARSRSVSRLAVAAAILCAAVFWPGVIDQADLDAKWSNAVAGLGVLLALALTLVTVRRRGLGPRSRAPGDRVRIVIAAVLLMLCVPWLAADLGFIVGRLALLGSVYYSDEWYAPFGHARVHEAVHAGNHHGLVGALLVVTVLLLSRTLPALSGRLRSFVGAYLAVLGLYGLAALANDLWLEQVVKRGVTNWEFPSLLTPRPSVEWLILLLLAGLLYLLVVRRIPPTRSRTIDEGSARATIVALPVIVALLIVGLAQSGSGAETPLGSARGIVFAAAPHGRSHLFVTRGRGFVQLTDDDGSELAPAWSPDRRTIAFQSNRDGNWELYVMRADGTHIRRLTHNDARDGEPTWSTSGKDLAFTRDGALYTIAATGRRLHLLESRGQWPAWSPNRQLAWEVAHGAHDHALVITRPGRKRSTYGSTDVRRGSWSPDGHHIAFGCRQGRRWYVCVRDAPGWKLRYLTPPNSDAFAPAWSPDGERIAFISDRDGRDELFAMRADGTEVVRITRGLGDIDTPTWSRR